MNDDHVMRMSSSPPAPLSLRLGVVLLIAVAMVGATQLTSRAQTRLAAPFCIMWAHAAMMVVCLPAAAALRRFGGPAARAAARAPAARGDVAAFLALFVGANYAYVRALSLAPPAVVQTVFGAAPGVVAVLSRCALGEPLTAARAAAAAAALAGVALVAGAGGGARPRPAGVALAAAAMLCAACYKVGFKRRFGAPPPDFVLDFVGRLGAAAAVAGAPAAAALVAAGREDGPRAWTRGEAAAVLGGGAVDVADNALIALGLALASPRAGKEREIPDFKGSYLGRFPLVSADFWTSDHLSERSRSMGAFPGTRARAEHSC